MSDWSGPPPPRPRARGALLFGFIFLAAAVGLGWYAYRLRIDGERARNDLRERSMKLETVRARDEVRGKELEELKARNEKLTGMEQQLHDAKAELAANEGRLRDLEGERAEVAARLAEFREVTAKFRGLIDAGTLDITFRRGRMIVELPASVLFDSGSAELSDDGKKAVGEVAKILSGVPDRRFMVGGHTDNVPAVKEYKSNWALSTARAVTVLEALSRAGMPSTRLAAAGYAEFDPIASNGTAEGKQKNRRIEIVIEPYLTAIPADAKSPKKAEP